MNNIISSILEKESIQIYFQAILSHNEKFDIGVEAFVKGVDPQSGELITPLDLFAFAQVENCEYELSTLIFKKTLELFFGLLQHNPKILLYFNINEIDYIEETHFDKFYNVAQESKIPTENIALDIRDSSTIEVAQIQKFIDYQRKQGFYICIDDIGKNYFNLDRIVVFNPDVIKINHQHLKRLNNYTYYSMVLKYISQIAHEMGMIVIEIGLESEEQLVSALEQGAQFFQGFYIHKPLLMCHDYDEFFSEVEASTNKIRTHKKTVDIPDSRQFIVKMIEFMTKIKSCEIEYGEQALNNYLHSIFQKYPFIENGWFTDENGIQLTRANINKPSFSKRNSKIFQIYDKDHDHSQEEFYPFFRSRMLENWATKPYISLQSNDICITGSSLFTIDNEHTVIISLVINYDIFKKYFF